MDWLIEVLPLTITPSVGILSPGNTFSMSPTCTFSTGILSSIPFLILVATCGVIFTSSSILPCVFDTVYSSRNPPIAMIVAISPAANTSPIMSDAIIASETSKSALMSNSLINPSPHSLKIGSPHRITDIQDTYSMDRIKLVIKLIAEIAMSAMSIFSSFVNFILIDPNCIGIPHRV